MITVIPTCGESALLYGVVEAASVYTDVLVVVNNVERERGHELLRGCASRGAAAHYWPGTTNIYDVWNYGIGQGKVRGEHIAILNDDIVVHPDTFEVMDLLLTEGEGWAAIGWDYHHPDHRHLDRVRPVRGSYRKGGIGGFAFAVHCERIGRVHEGFQWWGGDDDLFNEADDAGWRLGVAVGLGVRHDTSTSANARPSVYSKVEQDRQLLLARWGEAW